MSSDSLTLLRLIHLISPSLPIGSFAYSQGLEWLIEQRNIRQPDRLKAWLHDVLTHNMCCLDIPVLARLYAAYAAQDPEQQSYWQHYLIASRETHELRQEERLRGKALVKLLPHLGLDIDEAQAQALGSSQLAAFAYAAASWQISLDQAALGYAWAWLENQVLAATKLIPLGQSAGQAILAELSPGLVESVNQGLNITDADIGAACPQLSLASSGHETQYTRLFRS